MKRIFTIALMATFAACNNPGTGGVSADSSNKMGPDTAVQAAPTAPQLTDTTLPHPGDSVKDMIDTANSHVKMKM